MPVTKNRRWGFAWTIGASFGFEFIDASFLNGGWVLHLGIIKILYFGDFPLDMNDDITHKDFSDRDE